MKIFVTRRRFLVTSKQLMNETMKCTSSVPPSMELHFWKRKISFLEILMSFLEMGFFCPFPTTHGSNISRNGTPKKWDGGSYCISSSIHTAIIICKVLANKTCFLLEIFVTDLDNGPKAIRILEHLS